MDEKRKACIHDIDLDGTSFIAPVEGSHGVWYYGMDPSSGDLYEAEEILKDGIIPKGDRLFLIRYPEGTVSAVHERKDGVCHEVPVYDHGKICVLCVDFLSHSIHISEIDPETITERETAVIPLDSVRDCYNLKLLRTPLCLCRSGKEDLFEMIWPEHVSFRVSPHESLSLRIGERVYFTEWFEDPDYREETVIRDIHTGEILERLHGDIRLMPDGSYWHVH